MPFPVSLRLLVTAGSALALCACATMPPSSPQAQHATTADAAFTALADRFIASLTRFDPVQATQLGEHRYDDRLADITPAGRDAREAEWRALLGDLSRIDRASLSRDNQVDLAMLDNELRYRLWTNDRLQSWAWNAQEYNDGAAQALYGLAARDFAPWPKRLKSATARMEAVPAYLAEMRRQLVPARVPVVYAQTVSKQNGGIVEIADGMLAPHAGELSGADRARFDAALVRLKAAVAEQQTWLDTVLVPQAKGDFRLGPQLYDEKMAFALQSSMTRPELKRRAVAAMAGVRAEMYDLARRVLADGRWPEQPTAAQQQAAIEQALALSYAHRPARAELENSARAALAQATAFVSARGLVTMPDGPVKVITMPKFQQGNAVAYDDPPGALEQNGANFFAVSPIPDDWTDAQATSFLSEYNDFMIQDLAIHEAMPGHYLQLDHANKDPSRLRAVLGSGPFVEGWAVYAEGMMKDEGYGEANWPVSGKGADPQAARLFRLTVLKMRLRSVSNTLLDIGIQTEGMSRDAAMDLMMHGAFQQEREAAGKWIRASLSSTQLLSYFTGFAEHSALRDEAKQRWGAAYTLKRYNDAVLAHGSLPVKYVRDLMFGLAVE
ncbi:DUF885 domain-containing protein [Novosphingobium lentum]|uniref:DUF885 domain-containing protein n=1 Tax=Novosphingobium lentum TaxID=145287 RepID=UPI00082AB64D|nr:DUF885 domain-containing protein [Novosphingobium lentum]